MPPYFRFPEQVEGIQQRFWGCRARNPTCGLITLETGTKIFAWGNIIYGGTTTVLCILIFLAPLFLGHGGHHDSSLRESLKKGSIQDSMKMSGDEWIEKIYLKQTFYFFQAILFLTFLVFSFWWYSSLKLKKSVEERDLPKLKKYFFIMFCLFIMLCIPYLVETEFLWSRAFLIDIPVIIFQIMGLIFTHAFIVSLTSPEGSQPDDLNRIQFSV